MNSKTKISNVDLFLAVDRDLRKAIQALQDVYDIGKSRGLSHREIAEISGIDPSALSRIVNGKKTNLTLKTLARIMRATGHRMQIEGQDLSEVPTSMQNSRILPEIVSNPYTGWITHGTGLESYWSEPKASPAVRVQFEETPNAKLHV